MRSIFFSRLSFCTPAFTLALVLGCLSSPAFAMGRDGAQDTDARDSAASRDAWREPVVWEREYAGEVNVPDPSNWWVGYRLTGEKCTISLRPAKDRDLLVRASLWEGEHLARADGLRGEDFYLGELPNKRAFVLQTYPGKKPVAVSITGYDAKGVLVYGPKYKPEDRVKLPDNRECLVEH